MSATTDPRKTHSQRTGPYRSLFESVRGRKTHEGRLSVWSGAMERGAAAHAGLPLPLLALPQGPRLRVRDVRGGAERELLAERRGGALRVVARLLPLLLPALRLRGARRDERRGELPPARRAR